ncbi:hypothetical protein WMY93_014592 [Mugilogobius chulae]|uniref:AIG1-type G domain-containing protein n=1 Tax=Mugilogobius chulae TaxID=88201 RepID=A0AAW0NZM9_9GOBI
MEADRSSIGHDTDTNEVSSVHCTEVLLRPFFKDYSFQSIMATPTSPLPTNRTSSSPLTDLRLVLLGRKGTGKSSAGNCILGAGFEFGKPTEECIKRRTDVNGIKVTVVDTPGWEWYYPLNSTPNWVKRETLRSVTLCPPGPHAVLLVVRSCASVNEDYITEIEEHLLPLGTHVWDYTLVLFTRGDELGLVSMEQRIQTSPGLQKLLLKCKNRYHVMENRGKGEGTQVKELIRKLKKMVEEKEERCKHLEMENTVLSELEVDGTRRARERRKRQRQMEAQAQRGTIKTALMSDNLQTSDSEAHHSFSKTPRRLPEIRLILLGERETGKSSAGNAILGQNLFQTGTVTEECVRQQANISQRHITVVDTPGWDGGVMGSTPERVKREIVTSVSLCPPGPHAFLLVLRVDAAIRESHICKHFELLGENIWRYTILLFTHCDQLREGVSIEKHIQKGGKDLQMLLEKCNGRFHAMSEANGSQNTMQVTELLEKVEKMSATNRCEAFSGLVQEVKTLSRQKNEKYNQRFKELQEKMSRQEAELKKLRDREMKSLRWFFERKKKSKSPGSLKKQGEEDEEKRSMDHNVEEMEERMRLMIEDKEREIIDLNVEHERILAALHQSKREMEELGLNIELKEREIEELNERIDEQQLKILDLERVALGHEQEKQQYKEAFRECEKVVQALQQNVKMASSECTEWKQKAETLNKDLEQAKTHYEEEIEKIQQEKQIALKDFEVKLSEFELLLNEKEKELEQNRKNSTDEMQKAFQNNEQNKKEMLKDLDEMTCRHKKELAEARLVLNNEMQDKISEMDNRLETMRVQHFEETEQILTQHQSELNEKMSEYEILKERLEKEAKANVELKEQLVAMEHKYIEIVKEKSQEYENEMQSIMKNHQQEMHKKNEEVTKLSAQIEDIVIRQKIEIESIREEFLKKLTDKENDKATLQIQHEEELKAKMSEFEKYQQLITERDNEIQSLKCKCVDEINEKNKNIERILKEKGEEIEKLVIEFEELKQKQTQELDSVSGEKIKLQEKERKYENKMRTIVENHKQEIQMKDEEIAKLHEQIRDDRARQNAEIENFREELLRKLEEKEKNTAKLQIKHEEELKVTLSEFEKYKEQFVTERDNEIESIKGKNEAEIHEKNKKIEMILNEKEEETEKLVAVIEELKQKQMEVLDNMSGEQRKLQEREREYENEIQTIMENHKHETQEKEDEIMKLSQQLRDNMIREKTALENNRQEFLQKLEEKESDIALQQIKHKEELIAKMSELQKDKEQLIIQRDNEIQGLKCKYVNEIREKNKEIETILKEKREEIEELVAEFEALKQKQLEALDSMSGEKIKLQEREKEILQRLKEEEKKLQEFEEKKAQEWKQIDLKLIEKERLIQMLKEKLKDIEEMLQKKDDERGHILQTQKKEVELQLELRDKEIEETKQQLLSEIEKNVENENLLGKLTSEFGQIQNELELQKQENVKAAKMQETYVQEIAKLKNCDQSLKEVEESYRNKEREMMEKLVEKDKDLDQMRLIIEQTKTELNELTQKMEKEMTNLIQEYERGIEIRNQELEQIVTEKNEVIKCLQEEKQHKLLEVTDEFENSQKKVEEIEGKMAEEIQKLEIKCLMFKEESEDKDKLLQVKESELRSISTNYKQEILQLGQINSQLQKEKEKMKEDFEKQVSELAAKLEEDNPLKHQTEQKSKEIELWKTEKQNFEEKVKNFENKQEELVQWEIALTEKQRKLEGKDQERQRFIKQKEEELENLLKMLEAKQKELNFHGQDLQKKVRGLKDQGKELQDKEFSLRNQEQELISWTSHLNAQNEHVSFTTQQLDEMGRELASLKQDLRHKDQKYRLMFDKLNKWEVSLQEREAELSMKQNQVDYTNTEEDIEFMYQDIGRKDRFQKTAELAHPKGNNCHFETLQEIAEQNEGKETWNKQEVDAVKVINNFSKCPQNYKETGDWTILVLREAWSARSPSVVSILGGKEVVAAGRVQEEVG